MITAPRWRRLHGASAPVLRGGMCHLNLVRGNRFGSDIAAGRLMAPTRRCSLRSAHTAVSSMTPTWPRWCRSIPPASGPTSTRLARAPRTAQGALSNYTNLADEPADHALGRSRGGWTTKIHALIDPLRAPAVTLTAGQAGDNPQLQPLLMRHIGDGARRFSSAGRQGLLARFDPRASCGDAESRTPFPSAATRSHRRKAKGRTRRPPTGVRPGALRHRNTIERGFNRLKHWRGIATRYDKYALTFLGGVTLAATITHHRVRN